MGLLYPAKFGAIPLLGVVGDDAISEFEATLEARLPEDYRQFLQEWNGADFSFTSANTAVVIAAQEIAGHMPRAIHRDEWPSSSLEWDCTVWGVSWLNGIGPPQAPLTLSKDNPGYDFQSWAPARFLAIGFSSYQLGHVCISLSVPDRGEVYVWRWPEDPPLEDETLPNMRCMWWVASSFREYWDTLTTIDHNEWIEKWG
jgi:hypothetical protein